MKSKKDSRMVIAYIDPKLHVLIRKYCFSKGIPLHEWAKRAHEKLSTS